jgi:hypothetical protein
MNGDRKSVTSVQESIGSGAGKQGVEFLYPGRKSKSTKQNSVCCRLILLNAFCLTHFVGYLNNLMPLLGF